MTNSPPDLIKILPPPFEWCSVQGGPVTLADASEALPVPGTSGGQVAVRSFHISKFPITNHQYDVFLRRYDAKWWSYSKEAIEWRNMHPTPDPTGFAGGLLPRTQVSWYDAMAFCWWLSGMSRSKIALPTEAQWQRAAVGDTDWKYPYGETFLNKMANTASSRINQPTPVNQHLEGTSPFGVIDMSGNVYEWCLDLWSTGSLNLIETGNRAIRGGSFAHNEFAAEAVNRNNRSPDSPQNYLGFRVVCWSS